MLSRDLLRPAMWLVSCLVLGVAAASLSLGLLQPTYVSSATLYVGISRGSGLDRAGSSAYLEVQARSYAQLISGRRITQAVVAAAVPDSGDLALSASYSSGTALLLVQAKSSSPQAPQRALQALPAALRDQARTLSGDPTSVVASTTPDVDIVLGDSPTAAVRSPSRSRVIEAGAFGGLLVGVAGLVLAHRRKTMRT